jgi:large subunit ribosomal protein L24
MQHCHVKRGDEVVVIAGSEIHKRGKILMVSRKKQRALVEGLKMIKRHTRKSQQHPNGRIIEREGTIHISNLMLAEEHDRRAGRANQENPA